MLLFVYANAVWFFAGLIVGLTSFGGNLFAVPLLAFVMPARETIVLGCLLFPATAVTLSVMYRRAILWREVALLGIPSILGIPLGIVFLSRAPSRLILLAAALCVLLFLAWQGIAARRKCPPTPLSLAYAIPLGAMSGILLGAIGLGGPPLAFYSLRRLWGKENALATLSMVGVVSLVVLFPLQWRAGFYTPELLKMGVWCSGFAVLGIFASLPLVSRINIRLFRSLMLGMIAFSALSLLVKAALAW